MSDDREPADGTSDEPPAVAPGGGADLARAALAAAREAARARGVTAAPRGARRGRGRSAGGYSGPGPDERDPQALGSAFRGLLADRGWTGTSTSAVVLADWAAIVGDDVAQHSEATSLVDGVLTVTAESTAWATQLRLLVPTLQAAIASRAGSGVVQSIVVHGPTGPTWSKGPRRVRGQGPRDTYG